MNWLPHFLPPSVIKIKTPRTTYTPNTEEIEAVLDPLLDKLAQEFPRQYVTVKRFRYSTGNTVWSAGTGAIIGDGEADDPTKAVEDVIKRNRGNLPQRKIELEKQLADVQAELAALGKG